MSLRLANNLSSCVCAGQHVFLDLKGDRYFCLSPRLERAFERWKSSTDGAAENGGTELLVRRGLLVPQPGPAAPPPCPALPPATRDVLNANHRSSLRDVAQVLAAEFSTRLWLRRRPLAAIVEQCRTSELPSSLTAQGTRARAERIAAAFEQSALLLGSADRCLPRAVAAMVICHARRLYPTLVFGVRLNPFAAHSWVQIGDSVLLGDFEQVRLFTPILTVQ